MSQQFGINHARIYNGDGYCFNRNNHLTSLFVYAKKKGGDKNMGDEKYNQDGSISQQWLAEEIARKEGGEESMSIGQIKEQLKITLDILADIKEHEPDKFNELITKHD